MKKYQITLNEHQLKLISDCLEDLSRFMAGQTTLWHTTSLLENYKNLSNKLEDLKPLVTPELERYASYGWTGSDCPNEYQKKFIAETYYIYRTILYALHKDDNDWNVYKSPSLRCENSGDIIDIKEIK